MKHTLGTAAKAAGVSKSTIYRAVKSGKLSATRNEDGEYEIDPAELHRVYEPVAQRPEKAEMKHHATPSETASDTDNESFLLWLREKLDAAERELKDTRSELSDANADLMETQHRLNEHREAARLLEHKTREQQREIEEAKQEATAWKKTAADRDAAVNQFKEEATELAQQVREAEQWKAELAERKAEIKQARVEAEVLKEREQEQAHALGRERKRLQALESRSFLARLLNKKPVVEG